MSGVRRGMTLFELLVALVVVGLLAALARPRLDRITSVWRLRSAGSEIESVVRWARNAAVARGRTAQVMYDVPAGLFWVRLGEASFSVRRLSEGVRLHVVAFPNGLAVFHDVAAVRVFPDGTIEGHQVVLWAADGRRLSLAFNRLTGEAVSEESADASAASL